MFETETYENTLNRLLERVSDKFDKREGSVIFDTLSPTAIEFQYLYICLERIVKEAYGDTASREYLIRRCKERGISPYPATKAVLRGVFTPDTVDVLGKRFSLEGLTYIGVEKISDGVYKVECETEGSAGNRNLGALIPIEYVSGLQSGTLTEILIPAEDEEETEHLRERYFKSFDAQIFGGNVAEYLDRVNAISGVGGVKVVRVPNCDIKIADMIPNSAVTDWYNSIISTVSGDVKKWLSAVYSAGANKYLTTGGTVGIYIISSEYGVPTAELIDAVQTAVDPEQNAGEGLGIAPIGHVVNVKGVSGVAVNVVTNVTFDSGYSWDNLGAKFREVVAGYLLELRKTWADTQNIVVRISQIESRILAIDGVLDIKNTAINGVAENLVLGEFEVPIFGGVASE